MDETQSVKCMTSFTLEHMNKFIMQLSYFHSMLTVPIVMLSVTIPV